MFYVIISGFLNFFTTVEAMKVSEFRFVKRQECVGWKSIEEFHIYEISGFLNFVGGEQTKCILSSGLRFSWTNIPLFIYNRLESH